MITKLTKAQEDKFSYYVDKWIKIGLSTEDSNRFLAEKYIREAYEVAGLKSSFDIVWTDSPLDCANFIKHEMLNCKDESKVGSQVGSKVGYQFGSQVRSKVRSQVWSQVGSQVDSQFGYQVRSQVRSQVWSQVGSQVGSKVRSQVRSQVWSQVGSQVDSQVLYMEDYLSFLDFLIEECNLQNCDKIIPLMNLAKYCGAFAPFENICILQEKPKEIHMKKGLLHNLFGPSVLYKDGFCVYSLEGVKKSYKEWDEATIKYRTKAGKVLFGATDVNYSRS